MLTAATIYVDPKGQLYFCHLPAGAALTPPAKPQPGVVTPAPEHLPAVLPPFQLYPVPNAETGSVLNPLGAAVGKLVAVPAVGAPTKLAATLADATNAKLTFYVGPAFPPLQYGELIANGGKYYVLEMQGKTLVPDAATLAQKGYQASEAVAVADPFFSLIPGNNQYLAQSPSTPMVVRGDRRADTFLYLLVPSPEPRVQVATPTTQVPLLRPERQLLLGADTLAYYTQKYGAVVTVAQAEIDAVLAASSSPIVVCLARQLRLSKLQCVNHARNGGDTVQIQLCVDHPEWFRLVGQTPPDPRQQHYTLLSSYSMDNGDSQTITASTPPGPAVQVFHGGVAVAVVVNSETYAVGEPSKKNTLGWLDCPLAQLFYESPVGGGDQVLSFTAMTESSLPLVSDWKVQYDLTVRVDYAVGADGAYVPLTTDQIPNNIYQVSHFFVLMLENRSFDHLLGANPAFRTPGDSFQPIDATTTPRAPGGFTDGGYKGAFTPAFSRLGSAYESNFQDALVFHDPDHEIDAVLGQIVGVDAVTNDMNGKSGQVLLEGSIRPGLVPSRLDPANFLASFRAHLEAEAKAKGRTVDARITADSVLQCMSPTQAYAINALAENYLVCNRWFSSVPGPTWPNRFFLHCGTSGGISISPDNIPGLAVDLGTGEGIGFDKGSIFDRLTARGIPWRIYHSLLAQIWVLEGMSPMWNCIDELPLLDPLVLTVIGLIEAGLLPPPKSDTTVEKAGDWTVDILAAIVPVIDEFVLAEGAVLFGPLGWFELAREILWLQNHLGVYLGTGDLTTGTGLQRDFETHFAKDVADPSYIPFYTFIEPQNVTSASGGTTPNADGTSTVNSGHPEYGILRMSEDLIARVYNTLSQTPMWKNGQCALIVTYDEHGGIYDHVPPPSSPAYDPGEQKGDVSSSYRTLNDPSDSETYHDTFNFTTLGVRVPAIVVSPYHLGAKAVSSTIFDHASIVRTLQRRISDSDYLSDRVANVEDLFAAFNNGPVVTVAPPAILPPVKIAPPPVPDPRAEVRDTTPIPSSGSPNYNYYLDRAAEIAHRCALSSDPSTIASLLVEASAQPASTRVGWLTNALAGNLQAEKTKRSALKTMADAGEYLTEADTALQAYRQRVATSWASYLTYWNGTSPKDRYAAIRATLAAAQAPPA
ncbi:MAG TPA: alkaline phosphatase family protein [Polyangiaceae bacterium]|jgi:phospholipase C